MPLLQSFFSPLKAFASYRSLTPSSSSSFQPFRQPSTPAFSRGRAALAPKRVRYRKAHKGRVHVPTGGSTKGTTLIHGEYGLRVRGDGMRLTAKQLFAADTVIKRKLKIFKDNKVWLRVFPDIPVCVKGNETRMGKGKGSFEYWACRVPTGRVLFEIGGGLREEIARDALRLAATKLPVLTDFITRATGPKLGKLDLPHPPPKTSPEASGTAKRPKILTRVQLAQIAQIDLTARKVPAADLLNL